MPVSLAQAQWSAADAVFARHAPACVRVTSNSCADQLCELIRAICVCVCVCACVTGAPAVWWSREVVAALTHTYATAARQAQAQPQPQPVQAAQPQPRQQPQPTQSQSQPVSQAQPHSQSGSQSQGPDRATVVGVGGASVDLWPIMSLRSLR